jgi:hypothetical protein
MRCSEASRDVQEGLEPYSAFNALICDVLTLMIGNCGKPGFGPNYARSDFGTLSGVVEAHIEAHIVAHVEAHGVLLLPAVTAGA